MKNIYSLVFKLAIIACVAGFACPRQLWAVQTNFQIAPAPVPWPSFEPGKSEARIEPIYASMSGDLLSLNGGGINFSGRTAFTGSRAVNVQFSMFGLTGHAPGLAPLNTLPQVAGYSTFPQVTDKAQTKMFAAQMSTDLEFQIFNHPRGGLIVFGGPAAGFLYGTFTSPFSMYQQGFNTQGTAIGNPAVYPGYYDNLGLTTVTAGMQFGMEGEIIYRNVRLVPYFMTTWYSGSATVQDNSGFVGGNATTHSTIPNSTTTLVGADIIRGNFHIGAELQRLNSAGLSSEPINTTMFKFGYHF